MGNIEFCAHAYFVIAIAYNALSLVWLDVSGRKFAPTDPLSGLQIVSLVYLLFLLRDTIPLPALIFLLALWVLLIARFGIYEHLRHYDGELYLSRATWTAAIGINLFGVLTLAALMVGLWLATDATKIAAWESGLGHGVPMPGKAA